MSFEFQLVLTEECNLACKYCYVKQKPSIMTNKVFDAHFSMLPKILSHYNSEYYNAALFGGEPLLNWKLIEYIVPILNNDDRCNRIIVMTNGIVLQDRTKYNYLRDNNVAISLSFDGLWNKTNRPLKSGESSMELYLIPDSPLYEMLTVGKSCKVMVSPDNIDTLVENYNWFVDNGITNPDFTLVRDDVWTDEHVNKMEIESVKLADQMIQYILEGKRTSVGFFNLYILDTIFGETQGKRPWGCFAGCHGMAFMPNGLVYPCERFGTKNSYPLYSSIDKSSFTENILKFKDPNLTNPHNYDVCKECTLYKYCNAGCTYSQLKNNNKPLENLCRIFHILYNQAFRIAHTLKDNDLFKTMMRETIKNVG
jgi:radical SAM protein with 4Fe4S-binding SPASM domain